MLSDTAQAVTTSGPVVSRSQLLSIVAVAGVAGGRAYDGRCTDMSVVREADDTSAVPCIDSDQCLSGAALITDECAICALCAT